MDLFSRKTVVAKDMAKAKRIRIKAQFWRRYSLNIWVFYIFIVQQYQKECRHMHAKKKRAPYGSAPSVVRFKEKWLPQDRQLR